MVQKIRQKMGFSIAELLVAILILSMVSTVVAGGIPVARDAYNKITVAANAQVLLSTAIYSLRSELGVAMDVKNESDTSVVFNSGKNGHKTRIYLDDSRIKIQEYDDIENDESKKISKPPFREIVQGMQKDGLYATFDKIEFSDNVFEISGLTVRRDNEDFIEKMSLSIRVMLEDKA